MSSGRFDLHVNVCWPLGFWKASDLLAEVRPVLVGVAVPCVLVIHVSTLTLKHISQATEHT